MTVHDRGVFLSTLPAGRGERRLALAVVLVSGAIFLALAPFGEHFYAEVERRFPQLRRRIIFVTGDILNREKRAFLERTGAPHLLKPFDPPEVRRLVQRMLSIPGPIPRPEGASERR